MLQLKAQPNGVDSAKTIPVATVNNSYGYMGARKYTFGNSNVLDIIRRK